MIRNSVAIVLMLGGALFFLAGTIGLLRFPDAHSRLHALAKADTMGLGLLTLGLVLRAESPGMAAKLFVIWFAALAGSAVSSYLIASAHQSRHAADPTDDRTGA